MFFQLFIYISLLTTTLFAQAPQPSLETIRSEMEKIMGGHVTKKKMTPDLLTQGLERYLNQFDPYAVYLLEQDVTPFLSLTSDKKNLLFDQYEQNNFNLFSSLNSQIQKSIRIMRDFRHSLIASQEEFLQRANEPFLTKNGQRLSSLDALKAKHAIYLAQLVKRELEFARTEQRSLSFLEAVRIVELELEENENNYLFVDRKGRSLQTKEAQSLLAFHILKALTATLDAHTSYLNPQEAAELRMKLEKNYVGIGIGIKELGKAFIIDSIIKGSSADTSGAIDVGDELVAIDGKNVSYLTLPLVLELLAGETNSSVSLVLKRHVKGTSSTIPIHVTLQRRQVTLQEGRVDTSFQKFEDGIIGVINLHSFYQGSGGISSEKDVENAFELLEKQGKIKGIILDLRDNRGGFLMQAVKVAGLFIKSGVIVAAKYSDGTVRYFRDLDPGVTYSGPLIVLVSKETASAAEIVTEALKDYGVAIVVGDPKTFGKGSIQMQTVTGGNGDESYFKVTVGKYYGVSGMSTQLEGVKSDIVVPSYLTEKKVGEEYLSGALKSDAIAPSYLDPLSDVPKSSLPWFQKYYIPYVQPKVETYRKYIPELEKESLKRLEKNKNYQNLLGGNFTIKEKTGLTERTIALDQEGVKRAFLALELQETVNIMKDLIHLSESKETK
jgi:carboxyl-terminal processing protease